MQASLHLILAFVSTSLAIPRDGYEVGWSPYRASYAYEEIDPRNLDGLDKARVHQVKHIGSEHPRTNPHRDQVASHGLGGGNLLRSLEMALRSNPDSFSRQQRNLDSLSGITFGGSKRYDPSYFSYPKRSFDEIDRAGFNSFIKKRNFDEIDRTGFDSFVKKRNFDEIDRAGFNSFVKKRNFDEIDRAGFNSFVKRDASQMPNLDHQPEHTDKN